MSFLSRLLCLGLLTASASAHAATLFFEDFNSDSLTTTWRGYNTFTVAGTPYGSMGFTSGSMNSPTEGTSAYLYAQNNSPSNATSPADYFFFTNTATIGASAFSSLVPTNYDVFNATFYHNTGGGVTGMSPYFAVQVDGAWYASSIGTGTASLYTINLLTATWRPISFTAGTSMSFDPAAAGALGSSLFAGKTIAGLGFYVKNLPGANPLPAGDYRTARFEDLTISGVPEPSRAVLLGLALGCMALRRRRA